MKTSLMMAKVLFPGAVNYQYVPGPRVSVSSLDPADFLSALRSPDPSRVGELVGTDTDIINLEYITEEPPFVWAGMSKKHRMVFIYEEEE